MAIRFLFLVFGFISFITYSQDTLATDTCQFYMPNYITPNCEPYGCQFLTFYLSCDLEDFEILVFNKWGEVLYESTNLDELWDPFTVLKETEILTYQITGKALEKGELVEVKWQGNFYFLI